MSKQCLFTLRSFRFLLKPLRMTPMLARFTTSRFPGAGVLSLGCRWGCRKGAGHRGGSTGRTEYQKSGARWKPSLGLGPLADECSVSLQRTCTYKARGSPTLNNLSYLFHRDRDPAILVYCMRFCFATQSYSTMTFFATTLVPHSVGETLGISPLAAGLHVPSISAAPAKCAATATN